MYNDCYVVLEWFNFEKVEVILFVNVDFLWVYFVGDSVGGNIVYYVVILVVGKDFSFLILRGLVLI